MSDTTDNQTGKSLGIQVGHNNLTAVLIDAKGTVLASRSSVWGTEKDFIETLNDFKRELGAEFEGYSSVGLAIPGLIEAGSGSIVYSTKLPDSINAASHADISAVFDSGVLIENDANAAAYCEMKIGAGRGVESFFYVYLGDGVGGAFVIDEMLWRGANGYAGEFGSVSIDFEGKKIEDVASAEMIVERTVSRIRQDSTSSLNGKEEDDLSLSAIISAAKEGDDLAAMIFERTGNHLGIAISTVINLLNVEKVIIGGMMAEAAEFFLESTRESAAERAFAPAFRSTEILAGEITANSPAIGAAMLAAARK